jgi:NAD(P)-dependent dehydrogenase (short-subunit alcohol dehydrogenase family)
LQFGKSKGITVNVVAPGPVATDIVADLEEMEAATQKFLDITRAEERIGTTEDVADSVLLLVSERSRWITGQYISVSGGMTGL